MLRDALVDLMKDSGGGKCKLGKVICDLDAETAEILVTALRSDVPTTVLSRTLNNEGIKISREFLGTQRRQCFLSPDGGQRCCIGASTGVQEK